ncbi:MAG TPA: 4Fe-4S dicluster domain-containing protein [Longimicrobium sp.]|nr:4Fe-4S dicluster domain-containing protein [Longimicrobium sp.]
MSEVIKRRTFLKVLGATGAATAAAGCGSGEVDKLLPYVVPPEDVVPGVPTYYTTTCRECPAGCGMQVETHEGRVTKPEGNPEHPVNHGNLCSRGQASVQGLYHPDRYRGPSVAEFGVEQPREVSWAVAQQVVADEIRRAPRGSVVFLTTQYRGTMDTLADDFVRAVGGRRVVYAPLEDTPRDLQFADADLLVSFGADFLETWGSPVDYAWQFSQVRSYRNGTRGRFAWVGPHRPLTGLNADLWIQTRPGTEALVAQALAGGGDLAQVARAIAGPATPQEARQETLQKLQTLARWWGEGRRKVAFGPGAALRGPNVEALRQAVDGLNGRASAPAADLRPVQQLVQQMNAGQVRVILIDAENPVYSLPGAMGFEAALRRVPVRVSFSSFPDETARLATHNLPQSHFLERWDDYVPRPGVFELVQPAMRPVFNTRGVGDALLGMAAALGVSLTPGGASALVAAAAPVAPPAAADTSAAADTTATPGAATTTPAPAAPVRTAATAPTYYDYLRRAWAGRAGSQDAWRAALKRGGVFPDAGGPPVAVVAPVPATAAGTQAPPRPAAETVPGAPAGSASPSGEGARGARAVYGEPRYEGDADGLHLVVYPSLRFYDGRSANRPWLLELPDPVTKVSWDGWAEIHPDTAARLRLKQGDEVEVTSPHGSLTTRLYVWPGIVRDAVAIQMGLGHEAFGRYTEGVGSNPMNLLGSLDPQTGALNQAGVRVGLRATGRGNVRRALPSGLVEQGVRVQHDRRIARAVGVDQLRALDAKGPGLIPGADEVVHELKGKGGFVPEEVRTDPAASFPPPGTEFGEYVRDEKRWGMVIDLNRCIGCGACQVACSAENNVPVVGPHEIRKGRELWWLRIERYFGVGRKEEEAYTDAATDDVRFLPMLCQHCGQAPCEPVCPVYAAYHTPDGLNGQVYNRCVGTRYCAQNCPWKVRVFNWFTYEFAEPLNWQLNPDVTVREKGVMEKCTFCVQRIHEAERSASVENRAVRDGEVTPACVQTCPTEVFTFGNIADANSAVARAATTNRGYRSLGELNTQPAIVYLSRVTLHEPHNGGHGAEPTAQGGFMEEQSGEHATPVGAGAPAQGGH